MARYELRVTRGYDDPLPVCQGEFHAVKETLKAIEYNMANNGWEVYHDGDVTIATKGGVKKQYYIVKL